MPRLFLALPVSEDARAAAALAQEQVREEMRHSRVAWVEPLSFHVTLHFLGETDAEVVGPLIDRLRAQEYPKRFTLALRSLDAFPSPKRPRTIMVRASCPTEAVGLRKRTADVLVGLRMEIDEQPWSTHVTLGRVGVQAETLQPERVRLEPVSWEVASFTLMQSTLTPHAPIYHELARFALG